MAFVRSSAATTLTTTHALEGWAFVTSSAEGPAELDALHGSLAWRDLPHPMPIAAALRRHGLWDFDVARRPSLDDETFWYRARCCRREGESNILRIAGLATLSDVFVDGEHVLRSDNMFHAHAVDLGSRGDSCDVLFRFSSINAALQKKRPRPRWKTRLASHQDLRFIRTSLVGRMPGWSPPAPPIGPWRDVVVEHSPSFVIDDVDLRTSLVGNDGVVTVAVRLKAPFAARVTAADLEVGDLMTPLGVAREGHDVFLSGEMSLPSPRRWWPHTHGEPSRYEARVRLLVDDRGEIRRDVIELGHVAFRAVALDTADESGRRRGFGLIVNDVPVFCRGACWTTVDVATLTSRDLATYRDVLERVRAAGMNMVRLSGTMFYESDLFYELCDELGILVWQDFAFANMDYPIGDAAFRTSVEREARELMARLQARPSLAVVCGGSEVEQQAAMFGAPRDVWVSELQADLLPAAVRARCPDVVYWRNSPSGGPLPFVVDEGVGHYYGVGAYMRPLSDARHANVRFASECLAFANVPEDDLFPSILAEGQAPIVHARWKERTSKDHGSGWDFEDVRDHYMALLFGVDPVRVRAEDMNRYLHLARVTTARVIERTMGELRRSGSTCRGALVWFLQDLWPGAGWGILDSRGLPKSPYWALRRALQPLAMTLTDEGVNGLRVHIMNDSAEAIEGALHLAFYRDGHVAVARAESRVVVSARSSVEVSADAMLETFIDTTHAYRFGPRGHDVVVATLRRPSSEVLCELALASGIGPTCTPELVEATIRSANDGSSDLLLEVRSKRFLNGVGVTLSGAVGRESRAYVAEDNYFDVPPNEPRTVRLAWRGPEACTRKTRLGALSAVNLTVPVHLLFPREGGS